MAAPMLNSINNFPGLLTYLEEVLDWPINEANFEEATFDYTAADLGLKDDAVGGAIEIKQLRPLATDQPWGVFFLNLPHKRLPQTIVRNILGRLTVKTRASANNASRPAFLKSDLLFITSTGPGDDRRLAFAHFQDDPVGGSAATLKLLGWDANDTQRRTALNEATMKAQLHWPDNPADTNAWRQQWAGAFTRADTRTVVRDSKAMAKALAALARRIRTRATELIEAQTAQGSLVKLHAAFKEALIHDLTPQGFADTYAQTIAYGLLSTAISRVSRALTQDEMTASVAGTSPFLKEILGQFIEAGGKKQGKVGAALDFDELGVGEVVELLRNADMDAVLADFDRKNPDEDPVIHFYELFLKEYDAEQKVKRGVFYTPRPVVSFIVRSVDEVLRSEFGLEDGLASTATWGEVIDASKGNAGTEIKLPDGAKESDPFVCILDPATGTGTFLVECVDIIYKTMLSKWQAEKRGKAEIQVLWNDYVPKHLLPRLTGFELMMAPYAIAHVKLGLKLSDTGYTFGSDVRAQIYLTNALEPAQDLDMQLAFMSEALAQEAKAANNAKETQFTVVIGNPPYASLSSNLTPTLRRIVDPYRYVNGVKIKERNMLQFEKNIQDDYIKFIRLSHSKVEKSAGIVALITNHGYIDGITLRGVRSSLVQKAKHLRILDLHGNSNKNESYYSGTKDENVFEIKQGVAVLLLVQGTDKDTYAFGDIWGRSTDKQISLSASTMQKLTTPEPYPKPDKYDFRTIIAHRQKAEWDGWCGLDVVFPLYSSGVETGFDEVLQAVDRSELMDQLKYFDATATGSLIEAFGIEKGHALALVKAKPKLMAEQSKIGPLQKSPFDYRPTLLHKPLLKTNSFKVMTNISPASPALVATRQTKEHFAGFAIGASCGHKLTSSYDRVSVFPLNVLPAGTEKRTLPNVAPAFAQRIAVLTNLIWDDCVEGHKQGAHDGFFAPKPTQTAICRERGAAGKSFGPRDLFDYIYAVLHSPAYRSRYTDYLKSDFARIPLPRSRAVFEALVPIGTDLVATHLLDTDHRFGPDKLQILADPKSIRLAGSGEARVAHAPTFDAKLGRVMINPTRWFETVPEVAWKFHIGGYQPAQKWLKDRAAKGGKKANSGRILTEEDILHYRRIIIALTRTAELMPKIDAIIDEHGGWPTAFSGMTDQGAV
ncbi:N-6 DNA methylase [Rhizobium sp. 16-488-2a]|uniref:type ISP restriction/modification enzyme n=1 Tax=Rhizobium sp. 16-488-2a TaxID=2819990 RepID=UPI001ADC84D1|nr:type ISP restriction/modification enzyme [Rhizobium sp. 16-488-2a]MBO9177008.1 N-6 DNA methylase [Rhizobium sp. 16-488-2a]